MEMPINKFETDTFEKRLYLIERIMAWIHEHLTFYRMPVLDDRLTEIFLKAYPLYPHATLEQMIRNKYGLCSHFAWVFALMCERMGLKADVYALYTTGRSEGHAVVTIKVDEHKTWVFGPTFCVYWRCSLKYLLKNTDRAFTKKISNFSPAVQYPIGDWRFGAEFYKRVVEIYDCRNEKTVWKKEV